MDTPASIGSDTKKKPSRILVALSLGILITLAAIIAAAYPRKMTVFGQVFIVTQARENIKLGAVEIMLIDKQQVSDFLTTRQAAIDTEIQIRRIALKSASLDIIPAGLNLARVWRKTIGENGSENYDDPTIKIAVSKLDEALATDPTNLDDNLRQELDQPPVNGVYSYSWSRLDEALREASIYGHPRALYDECNKEEKQKLDDATSNLSTVISKVTPLRESLDSYPTAIDYVSSILSAIPVAQHTTTDAEGKFSMSFPRGKAFTLYATAQRAIPVWPHTETYYWLVDAPADPEKSQVFLNKNNVVLLDPDGYLKSRLRRSGPQ